MDTDKLLEFREIPALTEFENLFFPVFADDVEHGVGVGGFFEGLAEFGPVQQFRDVGERVEMFLKLALRHEEEHDELDGLVVERVEIDAFARAAERADDLEHQIRRGVRDADAEADAGGHGGFALFDGGGHGFAVAGLDFAGGHEVGDQLVNRLPAVCRFQFGDDLPLPKMSAKSISA